MFLPEEDLRTSVLKLSERVVVAAREVGYELDYSDQSIRLLDDVIERLWVDPAAKYGEPSQEHVHTAGPAVGAYVGEVLVRALNGTWQRRSEDGVVGVRGPNGEWAFPLQKGAKRLLNGRDDDLTFYYETLLDLWGEQD